jgi:hypothetical protein
MIDIKRTTEKKYQNCNSCGAINYESKSNTNRVKYLTYVSAGDEICNTITIRLCDKCLKMLFERMGETINNIGNDEEGVKS